MTTFSVNNTGQLIAALARATSGDTISVASGTYSNVNINNVKIAGNVNIVAANANKPPVFTDLLVKNSSGLTFRGFEFAATEGKMYAFTVGGSSNIVLDKLNVHGSLDGNPHNDISLMMVRNSSNVVVSNSEFQQAWHGLAILDNDGMQILNNSFHDIRTDGVRGGGTSNLVISNNHFTDFYPDWDAKDHPDAIQLWTTGTTESARNITISNNVVVRGNGDPTQGIFVADTYFDMPFQNVSITGNTVIGALGHGIGVGGVDGLTISDNNVIGIDGQRSNIFVQKATNATISNNEATNYILKDTVESVNSGNVIAESITKEVNLSFAAQLAVLPRNGAFARIADGLVDRMVRSLGYIDQPPANARIFAETVVAGTSGDDRLTAAKVGNSRVEGGAGDDVLTGWASGEHKLIGGDGNDVYIVKAAGNTVIEQANGGSDTVYTHIDYTLTSNVENLRLMVGGLTGTGNALDNSMTGSADNDVFYGLAGDDFIRGLDGNDTLDGGAGDDRLIGDAGNDTLFGGAGNDTLQGGEGNDVLHGGTGNDILEGGAGSDTMTGGAGADIFRFRATDMEKNVFDTITDFQRGTDKIDLSPIDAKAATAANDAFSFVGTAAFTKKAGELRYDKIGADAYVYGDVNGDGAADFAIVLKGVGALAASDFTL